MVLLNIKNQAGPAQYNSQYNGNTIADTMANQKRGLGGGVNKNHNFVQKPGSLVKSCLLRATVVCFGFKNSPLLVKPKQRFEAMHRKIP